MVLVINDQEITTTAQLKNVLGPEKWAEFVDNLAGDIAGRMLNKE